MKHFSSVEFVDAVEGRLPEPRRRHLDACAACAARVETLRQGVADARDVDVPEPSPLFWDHFANRITDAVRETPASPSWWRRPAVAIACSIVLAAAVVVAVDVRMRPLERGGDATAPRTSTAPTERVLADDAAWDFLIDVESTIEQDDPHAAPLSIRPATVDRAVSDLSAAERQELRRLLADEIKRAGN